MVQFVPVKQRVVRRKRAFLNSKGSASGQVRLLAIQFPLGGLVIVIHRGKSNKTIEMEQPGGAIRAAPRIQALGREIGYVIISCQLFGMLQVGRNASIRTVLLVVRAKDIGLAGIGRGDSDGRHHQGRAAQLSVIYL
jgi:hypothetical protein